MTHTISHSAQLLLSPKMQALLTLAGGFVGTLMGDYSPLLAAAGVLMLLDFSVGFLIAGFIEKNACSWKATIGLAKKAILLMIIIAFYWTGKTTGVEPIAVFFRDSAATAIVITEFTSLLENTYNAGGDDVQLLPDRLVKLAERFVDVRFAEITGREPLYKKVSRIEQEVSMEKSKDD